MIRIFIDEDQGTIFVKGHSGYAEEGKDIVCAGISALFLAFAEAEHKVGGLLVAKTEPGDSYVKFRKSRAARRRLEVFRAGAEQIARNYPLFVELSTGEKTGEAFCYHE